jgi:hypothetical protein
MDKQEQETRGGRRREEGGSEAKKKKMQYTKKKKDKKTSKTRKTQRSLGDLGLLPPFRCVTTKEKKKTGQGSTHRDEEGLQHSPKHSTVQHGDSQKKRGGQSKVRGGLVIVKEPVKVVVVQLHKEGG